MLPGPVFNAELLTLARRGRYYLIRTAYGAVLLFFIVQNFPNDFMEASGPDGAPREYSISEARRIGQSLAEAFLVTQSITVLLLAPAMVAGAIADERQRKTLHYLLASRLTSAEIVLGKLFARILQVFVFVTLGLPILIMLTFFGGTDPNLVLLAYLGTMSTVVFLASLAVLVSTFSKRPREAISSTYILEIVWLFGPSVFTLLGPATTGVWLTAYEFLRPFVLLVGESSPFFLLTSTAMGRFGGGGSALGAFLRMVGLQLLIGASFVGIAVVRLRPGFRSEGGRPSWFAFLGRKEGGRFRSRRACGDRPMLWKERHAVRTTRLGRWVNFLFFLGLTALMLYGASFFVGPAYKELRASGYGAPDPHHARSELNGFLRFVLALLSSCAVIGVASAAANSLTSEREEDTWISLISTPLTGDEIVAAKMFGSVWSLRGPLALWAGFLGLGVVLGAVHPIGAVTATLTAAVFIAYACALGTFFSLRCRNSSRALIATVSALLFTNLGYLLVVVPLFFTSYDSSLYLIGVTPFVEGASVMSYRDVDAFLGFRGAYHSYVDAGSTCVVSVVVHAAAAVFLAALSLVRFDGLNDRPRSSDATGPPEIKAAEDADAD